MARHFEPGDLVRYRGDISRKSIGVRWVVPAGVRPYGLVIETSVILLGGDPNLAAEMTIISVRWFDLRWNNDKGGISEEDPSDLELIQKLV
ncbi:MAG: hypothetical protein CME70_19300 [Halobacteriovorax sp.]|nr:hypothetical protein [Halobacteriovorax sp.]|tara:strand:+ start:67 stop:339 length:273 start_codon:yes stop_codon:yes gene_type:complete